MQFESDIYISYSPLDNESLLEGQEGWISQFHRALEVRVGQLLGKRPDIWRDPKETGQSGPLLTMPKVALLVSVLTPRYVKSEWCKRELDEFCKLSERTGGVNVRDRARIFKVVKTPVPPDQHPPPVRPLRGYDFFKTNTETGTSLEFAIGAFSPAEEDYWVRLDDLAHDVRDLLESMTSAPEPEPANGGGKEVSVGTVYLAETSSDLKAQWSQVKRDLESRGFEILPQLRPPLIASEVEESARSQLARCQVSVHMIGSNYGIIPESATESLSAIEQRIALERAQTGDLATIFWLPPGLTPADERQAERVASLRTAAAAHSRADLWETTLSELANAVQEKVAASQQAKTAAANCGCNVARVYLIVDKCDQEAAKPIEDFLFEQGYEVILPLFDGDEDQIRTDHEENLQACEGMLIYWGSAERHWLRKKSRELATWLRTRSDRTTVPTGVYIAPPLTEEKREFRSRELVVIRQDDEFDPNTFQPFLDNMGRSSAGIGT